MDTNTSNAMNTEKNNPAPTSTGKPFPKIGPRRRRQPFNPFATHLIAALAEFVGTFMFLFMAFAGQLMALNQASSSGQGRTNSSETVLIISLAYGISLLVSVWAFYRISGGLFNPAVSHRQ
jgi:aquaporin related protein